MAQADLQARQRQIDAHLEMLASAKAAERRRAAYWLGEAAVGDAIPMLVELYHNDTDRKVRKAAAYALGMFKAVETAIAKGEEERVVKLLTQVEEEGKLGSRYNKAAWMRSIVFFCLLIIGVALLFDRVPKGALSSLIGAQPQAVAQALVGDRAEALKTLRTTFEQMRQDVFTLQTQFQMVLGGGALDCAASFNRPASLALGASADADIAALAERINAALAVVETAYARYQAACSGAQPLSAAEAGPAYAPLIPVIQSLPEIEAALAAAAAASAVPTTTTAPVTPRPPTVTPALIGAGTEEASPAPNGTPGPTSESTREEANPRAHLAPLYAIVDEMTSSRGAATLLVQYWQDVQRTGRTDGCSLMIPEVPGIYALPQADRDAAPLLGQAVDMLNSALEATRTGWVNFVLACNSRTVFARASQELTLARAALASYEVVQTLLDEVRASL